MELFPHFTVFGLTVQFHQDIICSALMRLQQLQRSYWLWNIQTLAHAGDCGAKDLFIKILYAKHIFQLIFFYKIQQWIQIWILVEQNQGIWKNHFNHKPVLYCCKAPPKRWEVLDLLLADIALGQWEGRCRVKRIKGNSSLLCILIIATFNIYHFEQLLPLSSQSESTYSDPDCLFLAAISMNIVII